MRTAGAALAVVVLAALGACSSSGDDDAATASSTTVTGAAPSVDPDLVTVHAVLSESPPPCDATDPNVVGEPADAPSNCLTLGPTVIDATDVANAFLVVNPDGTFGVGIDLTDDGTTALNELAQAQVGGRAAMLVRGRLVSAPPIHQPSFDGNLSLTPMAQADATELVTALGGDS